MFNQKVFVKRSGDSISGWIWTINLLDSDKKKLIRGEILIRHCRGLDTLIICFYTDGFYRTYLRLLPENFDMR